MASVQTVQWWWRLGFPTKRPVSNTLITKITRTQKGHSRQFKRCENFKETRPKSCLLSFDNFSSERNAEKMFICSIRKLLELKCLLLFFARFLFISQTSFLQPIKTCTWFLPVACNDGQFQGPFSMEFSAHNEDFQQYFCCFFIFLLWWQIH